MKAEIVDLILREYTKNEFDYTTWLTKWQDFVHPGTGETGSEYIERMKDYPQFNPKLQSNSQIIILVEPLYKIEAN